MAEVLSIAASGASFFGLALQLTQSLVDYYNSYKDYEANRTSTLQTLESLSGSLRTLQNAAKNPNSRINEAQLREGMHCRHMCNGQINYGQLYV